MFVWRLARRLITCPCMSLHFFAHLYWINCKLYRMEKCVFVLRQIMTTLLKIGNINKLRPRQNGRHFPDAIFKGIFLNENVWISIKISLKFVPMGQINNISALVQIMAWRRPGDMPLPEPMMVTLLTHIYVTRPQWVNMLIIFTHFGSNANNEHNSHWSLDTKRITISTSCYMSNR